MPFWGFWIGIVCKNECFTTWNEEKTPSFLGLRNELFLSFRELFFKYFVFKRFTTFWISVYAILRKKRCYNNREGENKNRLRDFKFCLHDSVYRLSTVIAATQGAVHFNFNFSFVFTAYVKQKLYKKYIILLLINIYIMIDASNGYNP